MPFYLGKISSKQLSKNFTVVTTFLGKFQQKRTEIIALTRTC